MLTSNGNEKKNSVKLREAICLCGALYWILLIGWIQFAFKASLDTFVGSSRVTHEANERKSIWKTFFVPAWVWFDSISHHFETIIITFDMIFTTSCLLMCVCMLYTLLTQMEMCVRQNFSWGNLKVLLFLTRKTRALLMKVFDLIGASI